VATPLQPKARPAPIIVTSAKEWPKARSTYGTRLAHPRPTSTRVIFSSSPLWLELRAGAHSAAPNTPTTIRLTAMYSYRPADSPSMRSPRSMSTSRPAASAGCTTAKGASRRATT